MKKKLSMLLIALSVIMFNGCYSSGISMQTQTSTIDGITNTSSFVIGTTTEESILEELGGTPHVYNKADGVTKYIWVSKQMNMKSNGFMSMSVKTENKQKLLILKFGKNKILTYKKLITKDGYIDPDMAKTQQNMGGMMMIPKYN